MGAISFRPVGFFSPPESIDIPEGLMLFFVPALRERCKRDSMVILFVP
jgi:hypothetical protein